MADWSNDTVLLFLELFEAEPVLWNPKHRRHKDKIALHDAWLRISKSIDKPVDEIRKKKESLMTAYRRHAKKKKESTVSGAGINDIYEPSWFAYSVMERFLQPVYDPEVTINTEDRTVEENNNEIQEEESRSALSNNSQELQRRRRSQNPPELQEASMHLNRAFTTFNNVMNKRKESEDDCDIFAKLIANKLRKIPEQDREDIMYEIHGMIYNKLRSCSRSNALAQSPSPHSFQRRPSSSASLYTNEPSPQYNYDNQNSPSYAVQQQVITQPEFMSNTQTHQSTLPHTFSVQQETNHSVLPSSVQIHIPESKRIRVLKKENIRLLNRGTNNIINTSCIQNSPSTSSQYIANSTPSSDILLQAVANSNIGDIPPVHSSTHSVYEYQNQP